MKKTNKLELKKLRKIKSSLVKSGIEFTYFKTYKENFYDGSMYAHIKLKNGMLVGVWLGAKQVFADWDYGIDKFKPSCVEFSEDFLYEDSICDFIKRMSKLKNRNVKRHELAARLADKRISTLNININNRIKSLDGVISVLYTGHSSKGHTYTSVDIIVKPEKETDVLINEINAILDDKTLTNKVSIFKSKVCNAMHRHLDIWD